MSSEWWDEAFNEQYSIFRSFYSKVFSIALVVRILILVFVSYEAAFGNSQLLIMIVLGTFIGMTIVVENWNLPAKKTFFFLFLQIFTSVFRYFSIKVVKTAEVPFCMYSTMILFFFETYVFKSSLSVLLLVTKHALLWYLIDFENSGLKIESFKADKVYVIVNVIIFLLPLHFESSKKKNLFEKFELKRKYKEAHDQLYEILKVFPDGLAIFDTNLEVKFKNESIQELLPDGRLLLADQLKCFKEDYNGSDALNLINEFFQAKYDTSSLGIFSKNSNQYEWKVRKITWDRQECCMLSIRDVTKILSSERMAAENKTKNMIIRSISHEFRTPINCINLVIDECLKELPESSQNKLSIVKTCTELLMFQINDIIDYSNLASNKFKLLNSVVNLKEILRSSLNLIKFQSSYKGLTLQSQIDPSIPDELYLDGYRIQKIIVNLLTNAQKFTSNGQISLFCKRKSQIITIGVRDTGLGIPPDRIKYLFKLFTGISDSSLSGLGLSISQEILKFFNSSLKVSSTEGKGSEFSFDLKISQENCSKIENPSIVHPNENLESVIETNITNIRIRKSSSADYPKVLIVDDNEFNRMCLANILKSESICFIEANDGREALNKVVKSDGLKEPISVVIMDCNMPVMDGWESCCMIKQMFNQGKISAMPSVIGHTAFANPEDVQKCYESGMIFCIPKPSPRDEIISVIKKYLIY